jgi:acetyltransferase-like isoleucine patch superfamily enzyme
MKTAFKDRVKAALDERGLLPAAARIYSRLGWSEVQTARTSFKYYLYNHWLTNFPSSIVRTAYLRHGLGLHIGKQTFIHMGCHFEGDKITIGDNSVIGRDCFLGGNGGALIIKNNVSITARTYIFCASHDLNSPTFAGTYEDVVIEDYAWIGAAAMITPGVTIGKGAVLGAVAVATKDIPEFTVWAGVPAKQIGTRNRDLTYVLDYYSYFN